MKDRVLLILLAIAFLVLLVETRYIHAGIWAGDKFAMIPPITAALGFILCLVGLIRSAMPYVGTIMFVLVAVGPVGYYFHNQDDLGGYEKLISSNLAEQRIERTLEFDGAVPDPPPALAPMSFSGLFLIGGMICVFQRRDRK